MGDTLSNLLIVLLSAAIGYLFGAIPVGYLLVKATKGIDLREFGSGRTGGTNSFRAGGVAVGVLTSVLDVVKAACGVWLVQALFSDSLPGDWLPWAEVASGVLSVIGHNWSVFLGFRGGAGTGPNVGWAGALWFPIVPVAAVVVLGVLIFIGIASLASLAMSAVIPIFFLILYLAGVDPYDTTLAYIIGGIISAGIIAWSLRPNIRRLLRGEERLVGPRAKRRRRQAEDSQTDPAE
jgi:glycerol-3-phosphate acyltransferase PlsY